MLVLSAEPLNLVRVGQSPWAEEVPEVWYRVAVSCDQADDPGFRGRALLGQQARQIRPLPLPLSGR